MILATDVLPPPNDTTLRGIDGNGLTDTNLTFGWTQVPLDCSSFAYHTTLDCGLCPNTTVNTQVVCTDIVPDSTHCTFTVQTIACGTIAGNIANVTVKGTCKFKSICIAIPEEVVHDFIAFAISVYISTRSTRCVYVTYGARDLN